MTVSAVALGMLVLSPGVASASGSPELAINNGSAGGPAVVSDGQTAHVEGVNFTPNQLGTTTECNSWPADPNVAAGYGIPPQPVIGLYANAGPGLAFQTPVPISCAFGGIAQTSSLGVIRTDVTIRSGPNDEPGVITNLPPCNAIGPPWGVGTLCVGSLDGNPSDPNLDSAGHDPGADNASNPGWQCASASGFPCVVVFGDQVPGEQAAVVLAFEPPVAVPAPVHALLGRAYSATLAPTGGDNGPYHFSLVSSHLPPGLHFRAGTANIYGTPTGGVGGGPWSVTVNVSDSSSPPLVATSVAVPVVVDPGTPTVTLTSNISSGSLSMPVTFTSKVTSLPSPSNDTGLVSFTSDGNMISGCQGLAIGPAPGHKTQCFATGGALGGSGSHNIVATVSPDSNWNTGASTALSYTVS